ncbi:biosynthetic arginine decarboxylase [uncultured Halovibrio sp.]|uniref:biosynthetic arginine decarboxylase n=1 Tax=uncultured Halovibrio sp. TaxID=985049 RepID=UPI0025F5F825|nr:biosynthetic arginine decarboxylase [uncultured Halovibrio sp.]
MHSDTPGRTWNIDRWSEGYVTVGTGGELRINPDTRSPGVSLAKVVAQVQREGARLPVLIRFSDILRHRVNRLCRAFNEPIRNLGYEGGYTAVYPIKVNQQRRVVEEILRSEPAAGEGQIGLEAGSKPELFAVLALAPPNARIICNGYKDRETIRLALMGQRLGHRVFIVVEKASELPLILDESRRLGVRPLIGVRARLATIGEGNWQNTGGEKSKFGLSAQQVLTVVEQLREADALDRLQLLHFHLGSQIANIRDIQTGLREAARFHHTLHEAGAPLNTVDVGGGLGVDYEGTRSRSACSMNYSMEEYARQVVQTFHESCTHNNLPHPHLITESGRAMTAHHAVLVTNIIDREAPEAAIPEAVPETAPAPLRSLWADYQALSGDGPERSAVEIHHDAAQAMADVQTEFAHGLLSLQQRAQAEQLQRQVAMRLRTRLNPGNRVHRDLLDELNEQCAERLFMNLSIFQSLPDIWGIDQIFPILPLQGLDQPTTRRAVLRDMTCDSDGRIDHYVDGDGIETSLPLPDATDVDQLAFFMTGAYQEILGDMHNLFGDTDAADVSLDAAGNAQVTHLAQGETLASVLRQVNHDPENLFRQLESRIETAGLADEERLRLLEQIRQGLGSYTYLTDH